MSEQVKIPMWLAQLLFGAALAGVLSLQVYLVKEVSGLKVNVASLAARIDDHIAAPKQVSLK